MCDARHRPANGADSEPRQCAACNLPADEGRDYCAGHERLMTYTEHERSGGIAANE